MQPKVAQIGSIEEYVKIVCSASAHWGDDENFIDPWFRGIGDSLQHKLLPTLYREPRINHLAVESRIRLAFASRALPYVAATKKREPWEWYFLMQHYGVPTRLLDWTESALVALYFALYSRKPAQTSNPAVWVLNPFALNKATTGKTEIVVPSEDGLEKHLPKCGDQVQGEWPIAIHPEYADRRMDAQHSKFTLHGKNAIALEEIPALDCLQRAGHLQRIDIRVSTDDEADDFKDALSVLGVRSSNVYPDLTGLAKDLRRYYTPSQE
jgi:hypothetical protein